MSAASAFELPLVLVLLGLCCPAPVPLQLVWPCPMGGSDGAAVPSAAFLSSGDTETTQGRLLPLCQLSMGLPASKPPPAVISYKESNWH